MRRTSSLLGLLALGLAAPAGHAQCFDSTPCLTCHPPEPPAEPRPWPHPAALMRGSGEPTGLDLPRFPDQWPRLLAPADSPRPRPGTWWYGATVPYVYQRELYYPAWDEPVRSLVDCPTYGLPAADIYQGGQRAYWRTPGH